MSIPGTHLRRVVQERLLLPRDGAFRDLAGTCGACTSAREAQVQGQFCALVQQRGVLLFDGHEVACHLRVGCLRPVKFIFRTARGEYCINNLTSTMHMKASNSEENYASQRTEVS